MEFSLGASFLMSQASSSSTPAPTPVVTPCTACKTSRRKCANDCVLAPYFSSANINEFAAVDKIFGAKNITKLLQKIPEHERSNAMQSLVFEAYVRLEEPVYGCAGLVFHLHDQLHNAQEEIAALKREQTSLVAHFSRNMGQTAQYGLPQLGRVTQHIPPSASTLLSRMGQTAQYTPPALLRMSPPDSVVAGGFPAASYPNWVSNFTP